MAALIRWRPAMAAPRRDPFREVAQLQREMNRLWDSMFGGGDLHRGAGVFPALNVSEDENNLYVRAELPGVKADDLEINTQDGNLVIKGERKLPKEAENISYHRREREAGMFQRIISLPARIEDGKVKANLKDGVLMVTLPKAEEAKPSRIKVKTG